MKTNKHFVLLSGGLDSCVTLSNILTQNPKEPVECIGFWYGSKHGNLETAAARAIANHYNISFTLINTQSTFANHRSALLTSSADKIPEGHYEDKTMKQTVVPGRNMTFISIVAGIAESSILSNPLIDIASVSIGIHAGDHAIYPDCRPEFFYRMSKAVEAATERRVTLLAPLLHSNKTDIVRLGQQNKAPFKLTRTCYTNNEIACGKCGSCQERLEAFKNNGLTDPIEYAGVS